MRLMMAGLLLNMTVASDKNLKLKQLDPLTAEKILTLRKKAKIDCGEKTFNFCFLPFSPCLFDIKNDPCERCNLEWKLPGIKKDMLSTYNYIKAHVVPARSKDPDPWPIPSYTITIRAHGRWIITRFRFDGVKNKNSIAWHFFL